nr:hypothetical protein [Lachnospiraceae bacterium]
SEDKGHGSEETAAELYEAFLKNEIVAYLTDDSVSDIKNMVVGGSYTIEQISEKLGISFSNNEYIDCGSDGIKELVCYFSDPYGSACIAVKEKNGKLCIIYIGPTGVGATGSGIGESSINQKGFVSSEIYAGSGIYTYGYINAEGLYQEWFTLGWEFPMLFDDEDMPDILPEYRVGDKTFCVCEDTLRRSAYEKAGLMICTSSEIKRLIEDRRIEIGLDTEIVGDEPVYGRNGTVEF